MLELDRRSLLGGALAGAALPLAARAQSAAAAGFTHGVASGEPSASGALLWTRYVPPGGGGARVRVEVAEDERFARIVARGVGTADAARDHTVKIAVGRLKPGRFHYYRFVASRGDASPVGRTKTLPVGRPERFRVAIFSCSNLPFGFFNAYAHAAARDDIDLALHLGDYLYEYPRGTFPSAEQAMAERPISPPGELTKLADYRTRHAIYRADADLAALHARLPTITIWDDHEIANDSWTGGAGNHQPEDGDWPTRKAAALRAYREWLPTSDDYYRSYRVGDLLTLSRLETRIVGRDRQLDLAEAFAGGGDPVAKLVAMRQGPLADPNRQLLGRRQEAWLARELARSAGAGDRWQFVAQQVLVNGYFTPPEAARWLPADAPEAARQRVLAGLAAARAGLAGSTDNWAGYPPARERLLGSARRARANLVTAAGDSHNAWASELAAEGGPAGVEFGTMSVTAPGIESARLASALAVSPADVARAIIAATPGLKWCDTSRRGYTTLSFERDRVTAEFHLLDTVRQRSTALAATKTIVSERGSNRLSV